MPTLPHLSGAEVQRGLDRPGFTKIRQSGSHVVVKRESKGCVVPMHKEVKTGTLAGCCSCQTLGVKNIMISGRTEGNQVMSNLIAAVTTNVLQAFAEAWNRHDAEALMSFMSEDCVFEASAGPDVCGSRYVGREAVRASFAEVWATFPDALWANARHFVIGDPRGIRVDVHGNASGRHSGRGACSSSFVAVFLLPECDAQQFIDGAQSV